MQYDTPIGELLIDCGAISAAHRDEALQLQQHRQGRICQILMSLGYLTEETLLQCLGDRSRLGQVDATPYVISPQLTAFVPREFAVRHGVMPLERKGEVLTVAMAGSFETGIPAALQQRTGLTVRELLCARGAVSAAIEQYYGGPATTAPARVEHTDAQRLAIPNAAMDTRAWGGAADTLVGPETVRLRNLLLIVDSLDRFPLLPEVHMRILERLNDPEVELRDLVPLIEQDPPLSANILALANSAAYATRDGFDSVSRAVVFLGMRQLRNSVLGSAVLRQLSARAEFDLTHAFRIAAHCGVLTKVICDTARFGDPDCAFTAGLLADIGQIALRLFSQEYVALIEATARTLPPDSSYLQRSHSFVQVEESILGISASELGYQLARHWNLPDTLANTIRFHDRLDRVPGPPALAVAVALARHCLQADAATGSFGDVHADPELAWLVAAAGCDPDMLPILEERYRTAADHLTCACVTRG